MSTTVELVRANERYARLRAAVEGLAAEWESDAAGDMWDQGQFYAEQLRSVVTEAAE